MTNIVRVKRCSNSGYFSTESNLIKRSPFTRLDAPNLLLSQAQKQHLTPYHPPLRSPPPPLLCKIGSQTRRDLLFLKLKIIYRSTTLQTLAIRNGEAPPTIVYQFVYDVVFVVHFCSSRAIESPHSSTNIQNNNNAPHHRCLYIK